MKDYSENAEAFALLHGIHLNGQLGAGLNGTVWAVTGKRDDWEWALKIQDYRGHRQERAVYERLREHDVTEIAGFNVPYLLRADDAWNAIEMSIVERPFVLDFAQAYLDFRPDFPDEIWEERRETWMSRYEDDWPRVAQALDALECLGIYYLDVHGNNIAV